MTAIPGLLSKAFGKTPARTAVVQESYEINRGFRVVDMRMNDHQGECWRRGGRVQFHLDGNLTRTHMPVSWDPIQSIARFIFFLHGKGPGAEWAASLERGATCRFTGLKPCLEFCEMKGPTIFFGDETSLGSACALGASAYAKHEHRYLFEVTSPKDCEEMVRQARLANTTLIPKASGGQHIADAARFLLESVRGQKAPRWVFTGCAQSLQGFKRYFDRDQLKIAEAVFRPYWSKGKTGLQ